MFSSRLLALALLSGGTSLFTLGLQEPTPTPSAGVEPAPSEESSPHTSDGRRIKPPKKTKHVAPEWPENARRAGLNGTVVLECVIGLDGRMTEVKVVKGYRSLAEAAVDAVRKWRYTTTTLDGEPVPVIMTVTVNFKLQKPPKRAEVLDSMGDADPEVRWAAVRWLGRYRPVLGAQKIAIEKALQDPSALVREAAAQALEMLQGR